MGVFVRSLVVCLSTHSISALVCSGLGGPCRESSSQYRAEKPATCRYQCDDSLIHKRP